MQTLDFKQVKKSISFNFFFLNKKILFQNKIVKKKTKIQIQEYIRYKNKEHYITTTLTIL